MDADEDVDDRLGVEPGDGRAADVWMPPVAQSPIARSSASRSCSKRLGHSGS